MFQRIRRIKWTKWRVVVVVLALIVLTGGLALAGVAAIYYSMENAARDRVFADVSDVPPRDIALVLGARVRRSGRPTDMLADRVATAVDLYKAGKVKKLLMSGGNPTDDYDESTAMRKRAIELGMPPDDVVRDFAGFRTLDSVYRARDVWGVHSMVIVTQRFHLPRALYIADKLALDAVGLEADRQAYTARARFAAEWRDAFARAAAWLDLNILGTRPKYLGKRESLSGLDQERERGEKKRRQTDIGSQKPEVRIQRTADKE